MRFASFGSCILTEPKRAGKGELRENYVEANIAYDA